MDNQRQAHKQPFHIFQGRLGRKNFFIAHVLIYIIPGAIAGIGALAGLGDEFMLGLLSILMLVCFVLSLPLTIRRIHDMGYSGWLILFSFALPILGVIGALIGIILVLYLLFRPGVKETNKYGPPGVKDRRFVDAIFNRI